MGDQFPQIGKKLINIIKQLISRATISLGLIKLPEYSATNVHALKYTNTPMQL